MHETTAVRRTSATLSGILSLVGMIATLNVFAQDNDRLIHQQEGLWLLSAAWETSQEWCENYNFPNRSFPVNLFYDVPHEERWDRIGEPLDVWVTEKVVPAIIRTCGFEPAIGYVNVAMYRKPDNMAPGELLAALKSNKPRPWDSVTLKVAAGQSEVVKHTVHDAQYHMSPEQLSALDPRSKNQIEEQYRRNEINEYELYVNDGVKVVSWFDQRGPAWCEHAYVSVIAEYDDVAARRTLLAPDHSTFLEQNVVPGIKKICPEFPHAAKHARQIIQFKFRPKEGRIDDERANPHRLNFSVSDNDRISLITDLAYDEWKEHDRGLLVSQADTPEAHAARIRMANLDQVNGWRKGKDTCEGMFCNVAGGTYYQAILDNNIQLVEALDASLYQSAQQQFGGIISLAQDLGEAHKAFSMLPILANAYLAQYGDLYGIGCKEDLITKTITHRNPYYEMYDYQGFYEGQGGGEVYRHTYLIGQDMEELCDKVCDHLGGRIEIDFIRYTKHKGAINSLTALADLVGKHDCDSPVIRQFEDNLRTLTLRH